MGQPIRHFPSSMQYYIMLDLDKILLDHANKLKRVTCITVLLHTFGLVSVEVLENAHLV